MEVAVACATPRAGFERTLNFLPCPVFFFFFFLPLFFPLFLFTIFVDRLSLSLVDAFAALESRRPSAVVSTISNNSVDELSIFGSRRS